MKSKIALQSNSVLGRHRQILNLLVLANSVVVFLAPCSDGTVAGVQSPCDVIDIRAAKLFKDANTQTRLARIGSWSVHSLAHLRKKEVCEGVEARTVYSVPAQWPCKWKQIALTWFRGMPGALDICSHQPCCVLQLYSQQLRKPKKKELSRIHHLWSSVEATHQAAAVIGVWWPCAVIDRLRARYGGLPPVLLFCSILPVD